MTAAIGAFEGMTGAIHIVPAEVLAVPKKPRRNLKSAKAAGASHERQTAAFLAESLADDRIEVRRGNGINDRGDITGVKAIRGGRVVIECKNYTSDRIQIAKWLDEAETERGNDGSALGVVAVKRRGDGDPANTLVCMTLETFARLLEGGVDL